MLFYPELNYKDFMSCIGFEITGFNKDLVDFKINFVNNANENCFLKGYYSLNKNEPSFFFDSHYCFQKVEEMYSIADFGLFFIKNIEQVKAEFDEKRVELILEWGDEKYKVLSNFLDHPESIRFKIDSRFVTGIWEFERSKEEAVLIHTKRKWILNLKKKIETFLSEQKLEDNTKYVYQVNLENFYTSLLFNKTEEFPAVTADDINVFLKENKNEYSPSYLNLVAKNVLQFNLLQQKNIIPKASIEFIEVDEKQPEAVPLSQLQIIESSFVYAAFKQKYLMDKVPYNELRGMSWLSKKRDKLRNLIHFRLAAETMLRHSELINLQQKNISESWIHVKGRSIPLAQKTAQLLKQYVAFRKEYDEEIAVEYLKKRTEITEETVSEVKGLEKDYQRYLELKEEIDTIKETMKQDKNADLLAKAIMLVDLKHYITRKIAEHTYKKNKKVFEKEFEYLFISNRQKRVHSNTMQKVLASSGTTVESLRFTRGKQLIENNVTFSDITKLSGNQENRFSTSKKVDFDKIRSVEILYMQDKEMEKPLMDNLKSDLYLYATSKERTKNMPKNHFDALVEGYSYKGRESLFD